LRSAAVHAVWATELRNALRDRRTLLLSGLLPLLLYPMMGVGYAVLFGAIERDRLAEVSRVAVVGDRSGQLAEALAGAARIRVESGGGDLETELAERRLDAIVILPGDLGAALTDLQGVEVVVRHDPGEYRSLTAARRVDRTLSDWSDRLLAERLASRDLPEGFARPVRVRMEEATPPAKRAMFLVGPLLIFCIIFLSFLGVFYPAVDLTAGDRERSTIETLLTAPVRPSEVVVGKFLAVVTLGAGGCLVNVSALLATAVVLSSELPAVREVLPHSIGKAGWAVVFTVPTVAMFGALCMVIGCLARSFKDAQNYAAPLMMLAIVPAYAAVLPGLELTPVAATVPIANLSLLLRELLLRGALPLVPALICLVASALWCTLALAAAAQLYSHEELAFSDGDAPVRSLLRRPAAHRPRLSPAEALGTTVVAIAILFYVGVLLVRAFRLPAIALLQIAIGVALPVLVAWWRRVPIDGALSLHRPSFRAAGAGLLTGIGAWGAAMLVYWFVQAPILPVPPEQQEAVRAFLSWHQRGGPFLILLLAAVVPGVCEELLFRGLLLGSLRPWGMRTALTVSALAFTAAHFEPARVAPLFLLGLAASWLAWTSGSVVPAVIFHVTNNAVAVLFGNLLPNEMTTPTALSVVAALAASGIFIAGISLSRSVVAVRPEEGLSRL
jgi:sodium transport system permease protein